MPHKNSWGISQRAQESEAELIRQAAAAAVQRDIDSYETTSTYYGRTAREYLSSRYFQRST